jgi:DNA polymerase IV
MIHRTNSAPVASTMNEMPALPRKSSLLRYDISTPEINTSFSHFTTPSEGALAKPKSQPARNASTPNIGTIVMKNSTGIASMLGKKRKRKEQLIKLVPENDRIFAGKIFYYVPPDDNAPVRRLRITRARNYGATWTTEVSMLVP